jgi:hypothetical protein
MSSLTQPCIFNTFTSDILLRVGYELEHDCTPMRLYCILYTVSYKYNAMKQILQQLLYLGHIYDMMRILEDKIHIY